MRSAHIRARPSHRVVGTPRARASRSKRLGSTILLVAAQADDVTSVRDAFANANFLNPLQVVANVEEAVAYLQGEGHYADRDEYSLPALILLDLETPRK